MSNRKFNLKKDNIKMKLISKKMRIFIIKSIIQRFKQKKMKKNNIKIINKCNRKEKNKDILKIIKNNKIN